MRRLLAYALPLLAAVVAVALVAGVGRTSSAHGDAAASNSVTTIGHGTVTAVPDRATVTAGVHTQAATAAQALSENSRTANAVVAALRAAGGTDLQTQQVSLSPRTDENGNVTGYAADDSISASSDVAGAGALVDAAVAAGANTVSGPSLDLSQQDALYRQALARAVSDARAKAEALARAGGFAIGPVSVVSESSPESQPLPYAAKAAVSGTPVVAGTQEVTADVTVTFAIG